jgi:hypothetical protein
MGFIFSIIAFIAIMVWILFSFGGMILITYRLYDNYGIPKFCTASVFVIMLIYLFQ